MLKVTFESRVRARIMRGLVISKREGRLGSIHAAYFGRLEWIVGGEDDIEKEDAASEWTIAL